MTYFEDYVLVQDLIKKYPCLLEFMYENQPTQETQPAAQSNLTSEPAPSVQQPQTNVATAAANNPEGSNKQQTTVSNTPTLKPDIQELNAAYKKLQTPALKQLMQQWISKIFKRVPTTGTQQTIGAGGQEMPSTQTTTAAQYPEKKGKTVSANAPFGVQRKPNPAFASFSYTT